MVKEDSLRCGEHGARNSVGDSFTNFRIRYFIAKEHQMLQTISPTTHPNFSPRKSDIIYWRNSLRLKFKPLKHGSNFTYLWFNIQTLIRPACRIFLFRAIPRIELTVGPYCDGDAECLYGAGTEPFKPHLNEILFGAESFVLQLLAKNIMVEIYKTVIWLLFHTGLKLGPSHWGRNIGRRCARIACWGRYSGISGTRNRKV